MKKLFCILISIILVFSVVSLSGCTKGTTTTEDENGVNVDDKNNKNDDIDVNINSGDTHAEKNPVATIVVKDYGTIKVELYPDKAPNTVKNFIYLANDGFYNGLTYHRVIENFMIQGGCPEGTGMGDPGYSIKGEFSYNGFEGNDIAHERGVISMARGGYSMDSAGSQFFIMHETSPHLDGQYAAFGMVTEGLDVVDAIAVVSTDANDKPLTHVVIESISVDTFGFAYAEPETLK